MARQACALCPEALAPGCRHAVAAAPRLPRPAGPAPSRHASSTPSSLTSTVTSTLRPQPPGTALTRSNDGQTADGHDVAGHQDTDGLATGARRRGGPGGEVVAGGPLSPLSVPSGRPGPEMMLSEPSPGCGPTPAAATSASPMWPGPPSTAPSIPRPAPRQPVRCRPAPATRTPPCWTTSGGPPPGSRSDRQAERPGDSSPGLAMAGREKGQPVTWAAGTPILGRCCGQPAAPRSSRKVSGAGPTAKPRAGSAVRTPSAGWPLVRWPAPSAVAAGQALPEQVTQVRGGANRTASGDSWPRTAGCPPVVVQISKE